MSLINELEKLVGKASDKAADLEVYAKDMSLLPAGYAVHPEVLPHVWRHQTRPVM